MNIEDRNWLFTYETLIVVGIPFAAVAAVVWPWHGEFTADGDLETFWCGDVASTHTRALTSVRAEGRGLIGESRVRNTLEQYVAPALARALVEAAERCGRFEKGGEQCPTGVRR